MSSYTASLKSVISILAHEHGESTFAEPAKLLEYGAKYIFNYKDSFKFGESLHLYNVPDYNISGYFDHAFIDSFIMQYLNRDICCDDIETWRMYIQTRIRQKRPLYLARFSIIFSDYMENIGVIESESETKNINKTTTSQFPRDIVNAEEFSDVRHMDSGAMSDGDGKSTARSIDYTAKLNHVNTLYELKTHDVIQEFVDEFSEFFMGIY